MQECEPSYVKTFDAKLRGVDVRCAVTFGSEGAQSVRVDVHATDLDAGLRDVSRFAGYCERVLVLDSKREEDTAWGAVLASYYGFGLHVVTDGERTQLMAPAGLSTVSDDHVRAAFVRRVLSKMSRD